MTTWLTWHNTKWSDKRKRKKKTVRLGKTILQTQISTFFGAPTENFTKIVGGNIFFLISSTISTLFFHRKVYNVFFIPEEVSATSPLKKICMARNWHGFCLLIIASWCSLSEPDTSKHTIWKQTGADETNLCQKIFLLSWFEATPKKRRVCLTESYCFLSPVLLFMRPHAAFPNL